MNFKMTVEADNIKDLKQRLIEAAMGIEGGEVVHHNVNIGHEFLQETMKSKADKQLKEEASIHEMYAADPEPDVDNSVEDVEVGEVIAQKMAEQMTPFVNGQVDNNGMPWDSRIHAASRATNKDGTWRYRRNLEDSYIATIEAQLRSVSSGPVVQVDKTESRIEQPVVAVQSPARAVVAAPVFQPVQPPPSVVAPQATPVQSVMSAMTPQPTTMPVHSADTFKKNFLLIMGELSMHGKLTPEYLGQLKDFFGVKEIWEIMKDEDKVNQIYNQFVSIGLIQGV